MPHISHDMKELNNSKSRFHQLIYRHQWLRVTCEWLRAQWLMVVIILLFIMIVLCMINLIVMVMTT